MAKRIADKELTDRNWDQEEEGEEAGTFSVASEDVMKNRAIKKAKRRNVGAEGESSGAFKGFKGFSMSSGSAVASPVTAFSGFGNGAGFKGLSALSNGNSISSTFGGFSSPAATSGSSTPGLTFNGPTNGASLSSSQSPAPSSSSSSSSSSSNKEYSRQLTALNCSVRDWISKHVNDNPLCDLNPIFRDYERHLASIERQYGAGAAADEDKKQQGGSLPAAATPTPPPPASSSSSSSSAPPASASLFSFGKTTTEDSPSSKSGGVPPGVTFNFGQKVDSSVLGSLASKTTAPPSFSFSSSGTSSSTSSSSSLFGAPGSAAAAAAPLSFSATKHSDAQKPADENGDEESEEPPKPEVKEVKEDDAFYSKKCKLFYKKESEFKEKGVGMLHLKETTGGKTQMIIRADTNLGNILLNVMVQTSMPLSRVGKNNVMVVCVPNPPVDEKNPEQPVPLLIRVKTGEEADELHKTLEEKKT